MTEVTNPYDFDATNEPATIKIRVRPHKYVKINNVVYSPQPMPQTQMDGTTKIVWEYESCADIWVPGRVANGLTRQDPDEVGGTGPIAEILESTPTEAVVEPEAVEPKAPVRRRPTGTK